jgi:hypothetical protein
MDRNRLEAIAQKQMSLIAKFQDRLDAALGDGEGSSLAVSQLLTEAVDLLTALRALDALLFVEDSGKIMSTNNSSDPDVTEKVEWSKAKAKELAEAKAAYRLGLASNSVITGCLVTTIAAVVSFTAIRYFFPYRPTDAVAGAVLTLTFGSVINAMQAAKRFKEEGDAADLQQPPVG